MLGNPSQLYRLKELDALRGVAALMVTVYHLLLGRIDYDSFVKFGTTGVDLFFIISGFVIFMTIEKCKTAKEFIVSRFSRLFPAYWTAVTFTFIVILLSIRLGFHQVNNEDIVSNYFVNLTMLQHYFGVKDLDEQYWTLITELVFYVFILLLFVLNSTRYIKIIGSGILVGLILCRFYFDPLSHSQAITKLLFLVPLLGYFPLFFAGMIFYEIKKYKFTLSNLLLLTACLLTQVYIYDKFHRHFWIMNTPEYSITLCFFFAIFFLFTANKLFWIVNKYTVFLGEISYSLYLVHNFIGAKVIVPGLLKIAGLPLWFSVTSALIFVIVIAFAINRVVEKPAMYAIRNRLMKKG